MKAAPSPTPRASGRPPAPATTWGETPAAATPTATARPPVREGRLPPSVIVLPVVVLVVVAVVVAVAVVAVVVVIPALRGAPTGGSRGGRGAALAAAAVRRGAGGGAPRSRAHGHTDDLVHGDLDDLGLRGRGCRGRVLGVDDLDLRSGLR